LSLVTLGFTLPLCRAFVLAFGRIDGDELERFSLLLGDERGKACAGGYGRAVYLENHGRAMFCEGRLGDLGVIGSSMRDYEAK
jgi:hypothetical protein